jgi:hypothetical protein
MYSTFQLLFSKSGEPAGVAHAIPGLKKNHLSLVFESLRGLYCLVCIDIHPIIFKWEVPCWYLASSSFLLPLMDPL